MVHSYDHSIELVTFRVVIIRFLIYLAWCSASLLIAIEVCAETLSAIEEIEVHIHPLSAEEFSQPVAILRGEALFDALQGSIGATVKNLPGVRVQSFGQAVGRPVIHGLAGPRVKVMEDRIDTLDVSVTSTDHATTIEPFVADQIEILKGASTLLYGSGAIGGVVDVHTGRIPHDLPARNITGRMEVRYQDNADRQLGSFRVDGGAKRIAWHIDGFGRDAGAYDIPGLTESDALRTEEGDAGEVGVRDTLPGSQLRNQGGALGASWIGENGFFGAAISQYEANYGLPGGHGDDGNPTVDLEQTRVDFEAGFNRPFDGIDSINIRAGRNNYRHREVEPDDVTGTQFSNRGWEARLEFVHVAWVGWQGAFGLQLNDRDFSASGLEAFLNPVQSKSEGVFWVGNKSFRYFELQTGVRFEQTSHQPEGSFQAFCNSTSIQRDTDFMNRSASLGLVFPIADQHSIKIAVDYATRAPTMEELFSCGPHLASQTFDIGEPDLNEEAAINASLTWQYQSERWEFEINAYRIDFNDYIYQAAVDNGAGNQLLGPGDSLAVFQYTQLGAVFVGVDLSAEYTLSSWQGGAMVVSALFDTVRAKLDAIDVDDRDIPRIPASRYGVGLHVELGAVRASVQFQRVEDQTALASFERETEGYNDWGASLTAELLNQVERSAEVFVRGENLSNAEQRNHTSFIKDFAPAPGRRIDAGFRLHF